LRQGTSEILKLPAHKYQNLEGYSLVSTLFRAHKFFHTRKLIDNKFSSEYTDSIQPFLVSKSISISGKYSGGSYYTLWHLELKIPQFYDFVNGEQ